MKAPVRFFTPGHTFPTTKPAILQALSKLKRILGFDWLIATTRVNIAITLIVFFIGVFFWGCLSLEFGKRALCTAIAEEAGCRVGE